MAPKLYMTPASPPARTVLLVAEAINLKLDLENINLLAGEHLSPEFVKINPQHTLPTLDDNGFILWESHAIITYLVSVYGKDDSLYPKDFKKRAIIDQRMYFISAVLFTNLRRIVALILYKNAKIFPSEMLEELEKCYEFLEAFLEGQKWLAGDSLTLADLSGITTLTTCDVLKPVDTSKFPRIASWMKNCQNLPYYEKGNAGVKNFREAVLSKMNSN